MKNSLRYIFGSFIAFSFAVAAHAADLVSVGFSASEVFGDVTTKADGGGPYVALAAGTMLKDGAVIKTGENSTVSITFASGAVAMIRPNTEIEITKFEQAVFSGMVSQLEEPSQSNTKMKLLRGEVVSKVKKLKPSSEYSVVAPNGAAGVRGTFFSVSYDPVKKTLTVSTLEGSVVVTLPDGTTFDTAFANQQIIIEGETGKKDRLPLDKRQFLERLAGFFGSTSQNQSLLRVLNHFQIGVSPNQ